MSGHRSCLTSPTLQPRHFDALGLTSRQLHIWTGVTGFEEGERESGKWRTFSPYDVLRLATIRELKRRGGKALVEQGSLFSYLSSRSFAADCVRLWESFDRPHLVTDQDKNHILCGLAGINPSELYEKFSFYVVLSLDTAMWHFVSAIWLGGSKEQKDLALQLTANHEHHARRRSHEGRALRNLAVEVEPLTGEELETRLVAQIGVG